MYLTIISSGERNWNALVPELNCIVTAPNREELLKLTRESIAVALEDVPAVSPTVNSVADISPGVRAELDGSEEILFLNPASMNPVSLEIEQTLNAAGVSQAELARRIGSSRSAVNRLVNPFYWGHSLDVLRRVAEALNTEVQVKFAAKAS
ncbi:helix-turn-helix transcriptional regulator [Deinococcus sp. AJ005]|uniref:helix-turn-helix domain-containing protein n=1 Tax=Deinococcus sp. AJ005 TaxID=2652443 RepID=UPI00125CBDFB|nr:helix-turn-helix transcriptional regulator [Deinococcus sp. AJ005]QFP76303.1 helix-turn-helix transcriptional regulator [Deinococcus sp. AJ005]